MQKEFLNKNNLGTEYLSIFEDIQADMPLAIYGLSLTHSAILVATAFEKRRVVITDTLITAQRVKSAIEGISGKEVALLFAKDDTLLYKDAISKDRLFQRIQAMWQIQHGTKIIVADIESLLQLFPVRLEELILQVGKEFPLVNLTKILVAFGYSKVTTVEGKGQFAVRGDIVDIFPIQAENPCRIDFFDNLVEKIKPYDLDSGERLTPIDEVAIVTATDCTILPEEEEYIRQQMQLSVKNYKERVSYERATTIANDFLEKLEHKLPFAGQSFVMPLLKNSTNFANFLGETSYILYEEKKIEAKLLALEKEHNERCKMLESVGEIFPFSKGQMMSTSAFLERLQQKQIISMQLFSALPIWHTPIKEYTLQSTTVAKYQNAFINLVNDLKVWSKTGYRVLLFCGSKSREQKMQQFLLDEGLPCSVCPPYLEQLKKIAVTARELETGIILHEQKLVLLGTNDIYTKIAKVKRLKRKRNQLFQSPEIGDFAVHEIHGIGKIVGTKVITTTDGSKEYIAVEYKSGDMLYVPVEQMDILSKYSGSSAPKLSKLGGADFERIKAKIKASIKEMAFDLKALYAERAKENGFICSNQKEQMQLFEDAFLYTETEDQLYAIAEIKADMCSNKVMDRLLCGDVGFGKTEVAFRAIYLAILNGKQTALLCPNTVLSQQHYNTALERFAEFGVSIALLNRLKTPMEQQKILQHIREGKIDLVIGTHRLLSKDVHFKDLGLLVLDEEQRFGVEHKEQIKALRKNIDCLTMSATPIPRTLHMSLSGIRDISTIETPPSTRIPVQTYVVEETENLIRDACLRELARNGQVFILYNRVESIQTFATTVQNILPEGKITVAHGQMDKQQLENNILNFYNGESNILISTTIIENGIDLPTANTIIVIDADKLGIAQLYQLRGRVGRSNILAHAYFTFKGYKVLTESAQKRLDAILQFTELGSGFKIAMQDLEIRGAGNIMGREQHGHMDKVGYELYAKLLKEELSGEVQSIAELDIRAEACIPEQYIEATASRLDCYKQIAEIKTIEDYKRVYRSIEDMYGKMPNEVLNLLIIAVLKSYAMKLNVQKIVVHSKEGRLELPSLTSLQNKTLMQQIQKNANIQLDMSTTPAIVFTEQQSVKNKMVSMTNFLKSVFST